MDGTSGAVSHGLSMTIETITPVLAASWLERNERNRPSKTAKIAQYAQDMRDGNWRVNGEAIKFSATDRLLDGQNRLFACVLADVAFTSYVLWGADDKLDQPTMDAGSPRSYADALQIRGEKNTRALAAAVRSLHAWLSGVRRFDGGASKRQASNAVLDQTLATHPEIRDAVAMLKHVSRVGHVPMSVLGALWWAFREIDKEDCQYFFDRLISEEDHHQGEPIFALRRALAARHNERGVYVDPNHLAAIMIKAWNAYRDGTPMQVLMYKPGGKYAEKFPVPR